MLKHFIYSLAVLIITVNAAMAETYIQQIQSPIYTDEIGRSHFLGKGGYSAVRQTQMQQAQSDFVNDAVTNLSNKKETLKNDIQSKNTYTDTDITNNSNIPVTSKKEASYTDSSAFQQNSAVLNSGGVNSSKTIYTDDIGRLHFFGKGNLIRE